MRKLYLFYKSESTWHCKIYSGEFLPFMFIVSCTQEEADQHLLDLIARA